MCASSSEVWSDVFQMHLTAICGLLIFRLALFGIFKRCQIPPAGAGANWNKDVNQEDQGAGGVHRVEGSGEGADDGGRTQGGVGDGEKAEEKGGREEGSGKLVEGSGSDDDLGNGSKKRPQPTPPYAPGGFGLRGSLENRGEFRQKWRAGEGRIVQLKLGSRGQTVPGPYSEAKRIHIPEDRDALLDVTPSVVHFEDFMHLGVPLAKRTVSVTNVGGTLRRLRVMPAQSPFFTVTSTLLRNKGRLAPGMTATISIVFTPQVGGALPLLAATAHMTQ